MPRQENRFVALEDERLLEPGWAGFLELEELAFIKRSLRSKRSLRTAWGFIHGMGTINDDAVRLLAMKGQPDDRAGNIQLLKDAKSS